MTAPAVRAAAVVVPIYGVRDYLENCLDSILEQSISAELEVVLVDDGSTDGSAEIAERFAHGRVGWTLVTQHNGGPGPGAARNRGLEEVKAAYVLFCDGDDALEKYAMERLVAAAEGTGSDIAVGAAQQFPQGRTWLWSHLFEPLDGAVLAGSLPDFPDLIHHPAPGDKLFRTGYLRDHGLRFAERVHHQDTLVSVPALLGPSRIALVRAVVQLYRRREDGSSIMDSHYTRPQNTWDHLHVVQELSVLREGLTPDRRTLLDAFLVRSFQGFLARGAALPAHQREQLFHEARAVYADVDPQLVLAATDGAVHMLPYAALLEGDLTMFSDPSRGVTKVDLGDELMRLEAPVSAIWRRGLAIGRLRGAVTSLTVRDGLVEISGTVRVTGAPALVDLPVSVMLRLRGASVTVPATLSHEDGAAALTVSRFSARLPLSSLRPGKSALRLVLDDGEGQRSGRLSVGEMAGHSCTARGLLLTVGQTEDGAAQLAIEPDTSAEAPSAGLRAVRGALGRLTRRSG